MSEKGIRHSATRSVYRVYRSMKNNLQHKEGLMTKIFFRLLGVAEVVLSGNRGSNARKQDDSAWRKNYEERYGSGALFEVLTDHAVAVDSIDHQLPRGATHDSSTNPRFNQKAYQLFGRNTGLKFLDLGCAGGGLVRSFLEDGNIALGLEGSDIPRREKLYEWGNCPLHLFTCDITQPFTVRDKAGEELTFDLVTAWEVLEHIPSDRLSALIDNIQRHLRPGGYFIASVDQTPDINPLTGAVYHVTLQDRAWWTHEFVSRGFRECTEHPFLTEDFVRGNGLGLKNWDPAAGDGFHLILQKA